MYTAPTTLILDSASTSMREVVAANAPWIPNTTIPRLYESIDRVRELNCPVLVIHGGGDTLVPLTHGLRIYDSLPEPKRLHVIEEAGHNDISACPDYYRRIMSFLRDPLEQ